MGGGLNAKAGTIEALDAVVAKLTAGGSLATISEEAQKAAQSLQDKYAEYYVKVFDKLRNSDGYVEKELARLDGLLRKGGLAPEKVDDLTSRSNILRKFTGNGKFRDEL